MRIVLILALLALSSMMSLEGCIMRPPPTPEELEMKQKLMQSLLDRMNHVQNPQSESQVKLVRNETTLGEPELAQHLAAFPELPAGAQFVKKKDGFEANGIRHIDPEGQIVKYGTNPHTGDVTYLAQVGQESYLIKSMRIGSEPITIATAERTQRGWSISTVTGKKLSGDSLIPLSRGFLVGRGTAGFLYTPGKGISNFAGPDDFILAHFQNGDIEGTRFVLLERRAIEKQDKVGGLIDSVKNLGSVLGVNKKEDYLLFNIDTKRQVPINISMDGKNEAAYSGCRKKNSLVNGCAKVDFFESLFDQYGQPNGGHYYWRISWLSTGSGPLLITTENSMRETYLENLSNSKKATLFNRLLGINYVIVTEQPDGKVTATAKMGFDTQNVDDVEHFLDTAAETASSGL